MLLTDRRTDGISVARNHCTALTKQQYSSLYSSILVFSGEVASDLDTVHGAIYKCVCFD